MNKKILIIGGNAWSIINFRGDLINKLKKRGNQIFSISNLLSSEEKKEIKRLGVEPIGIEINSNRVNIISDLVYFLKLRKVIISIAPDIVISYTMKPIVYSGLALFNNKKIKYFPMITGTGHIFNENSLLIKIIRLFLIIGLKLSLLKATKIIFQNKDNFNLLEKYRIVRKNNSVVVNGSGVDTNHYHKSPLPNSELTFILIARLLIDKGIREYVEAAKLIKKKYKRVKFKLIGPRDYSLNKIDYNYILRNHEKKIINYLGFCKDVRSHITKSHVYVLPSYHEGLPRSVLEAMSMQRPIITTNAPGCKETVVNGVNGFKVPKKNINELYKRMIWFIENKKKLKKMGEMSRKIVETKFSNDKINNKLIKIILKN